MDSIRRQIEAEEEMILAPWACHAAQSLGREYEEEPDPLRTCFMRDRDRIIHTKAFRRLKHKTQVYIAPENDHYRTRLTHTLEVNQIARSIGRGLKLNCDLIEAIALGHDVGHTPFAHTGERVLDRLMPGGFAHNENSLRVLSKLETRSDGVSPLNLSKEVLDGVLHHSGLRGEGSNMPMTLEGQVVRLCDKIAYVQHDIDDSVRTGLFSLEEIPRAWMQILGRNHGQRINTLVGDVIEASLAAFRDGDTTRIRMSEEKEEALIALRKFMFDRVYHGELCNSERVRADYIVAFLVEYYRNHPQEMPALYRNIMEAEGLDRAVCDYISGMTDTYCTELFKELTIPRSLLNKI